MHPVDTIKITQQASSVSISIGTAIEKIMNQVNLILFIIRQYLQPRIHLSVLTIYDNFI